MRYQTLDQWLRWQETLHPRLIDLGLDRVRQVMQGLHAENPPFTVITVGGTNGKGSSVALLESVFLSAGYQVGAYTSPHLLRYNERIRLNGHAVDDAQICQAFQRIDEARGDISLTYFEFGTLAALDIFYCTPLDVVVLEVGLGGRLDAVNIIDSDVALITAIDLDHTDWLGPDRESIAREKAGIMRSARPVICSDAEIPAAIYGEAERLSSELYCLGRDFSYEVRPEYWVWTDSHDGQHNLPFPALSGEHQLRNAAGVMMVLQCLAEKLPVPYQAVQQALTGMQVTGRQQILAGKTDWIFDVAHNAQSAEVLADLLLRRGCRGTTHAIVGILKDKDIAAVLRPMQKLVTHWHCVDLAVPRGAEAGQLQVVLEGLSVAGEISCYRCVSDAMQQVQGLAGEGDQVVVFGSFYTVAEALQRGV